MLESLFTYHCLLHIAIGEKYAMTLKNRRSSHTKVKNFKKRKIKSLPFWKGLHVLMDNFLKPCDVFLPLPSPFWYPQGIGNFTRDNILIFSFFSEISLKNENVVPCEIANWWWMFKIGPDMIGNITRIKKFFSVDL